MLSIRLEEETDIMWIVLPVAIKCNGIGKAHLKGSLKTTFQGVSLTTILSIFYDGNTLYGMKNGRRVVC